MTATHHYRVVPRVSRHDVSAGLDEVKFNAYGPAAASDVRISPASSQQVRGAVSPRGTAFWNAPFDREIERKGHRKKPEWPKILLQS
jgi:hypothetical protein